MKIVTTAAATLAMLLASVGPATASNAALRKQARGAAQKYLATHDINAVRPSIRVTFKPGGRVEAEILGRLYAKGKGGVTVTTKTRFSLYRVAFKTSGQKLRQEGAWKAIPRPMF
jgi:hypothetical protein